MAASPTNAAGGGAALVCPVCRSPDPVTASKTVDASTYWRCRTCGEIWNVGRRQAGGSDAAPPRRVW